MEYFRSDDVVVVEGNIVGPASGGGIGNNNNFKVSIHGIEINVHANNLNLKKRKFISGDSVTWQSAEGREKGEVIHTHRSTIWVSDNKGNEYLIADNELVLLTCEDDAQQDEGEASLGGEAS